MKKLLLITTLLSTAVLAKASNKPEVEIYKIGSGKPVLMIIAGMHGNERSGIELMLEKRDFPINKGTIVVLPEVNKDASLANKRTAKDKVDLNRAFGKKEKGFTYDLVDTMCSIIKEENPELILDLHESKNPNNGTDANYYLGNSLIFTDQAFDKIGDLVLESDLSLISNAPKGSMNRFISSEYKIPVITVETAQTESVPERQERYIKFINQTLEFMGMK